MCIFEVKRTNMSHVKSLRVLWSLTALLLMAVVRGGHLSGDPYGICAYCQMGDLTPCNGSDELQYKVDCESRMNSCILGQIKLHDDSENQTLSRTGPDQVCLLPNNIATDHVITASTNSPDISESTLELTSTDAPESRFPSTVTTSTSNVDDLDYPADQALDAVDSFRSVDGASQEVSPANAETIDCFVCNSSSGEACLANVDKLNTIKCSSSCITIFDDGVLTRNCSSQFQPDALVACHKPDNTSCQLCQTPKCNKSPWNRCYRCTSNDDPNCSLWSTPDAVSTEICPNFDDVCSVRVTKDGDTVRGCSRPKTKCAEDEICSSCDKALCNGGVFPANRTRCIQCLDCEAEQDPQTAMPCQRYTGQRECFFYVTAKSKMIRGCVSSAEDMKQCQASGPKCVTCGDRDGCNNVPLTKDPSLSCHRCLSKEDPTCAWSQLPKTPVKCQNKVLYYLQESCLMEYDADRKSAVRACSFDHGACTPEDKNCFTCTGDGCNSGNLKVQECIQCNSASPGQATCSKLAEGLASTKCPQEMQPYQSRGCFTMTKGNVTTRGCVVGLSAEDLRLCMLDEQARECRLCTDDGCNNRRAPSSGRRAAATALLVWTLGILISV